MSLGISSQKDMRNVFTDREEEHARTQLHIGIVYPICIVIFIAVITLSIWRREWFSWIICIPLCVHTFFFVIWVRQLWRYLHRVKGEKKKEFLSLYWRLHDYAAKDNILEIALTIQDMATLVEGSFDVVRDFVFQNAGGFLIGGSALPLRIPESALLLDTLQVLEAKFEDLPEYLSSERYWERDAASRRLAELQSAVQ